MRVAIKRWVLNRHLKVGKSEQSWMCFGKEFQRVGAGTEKVLLTTFPISLIPIIFFCGILC